MVKALASVGPEQGLHTMPNKPPMVKAPPKGPALNRKVAALAHVALGSINSVNRSFSERTRIASPSALSGIAPATRM